MPDISMCMNKLCKKRDTCYRYLALPNAFRQSYMSPPTKDCNYHWKIEKGDVTRQVKYVDQLFKGEKTCT